MHLELQIYQQKNEIHLLKKLIIINEDITSLPLSKRKI